MTRSEIRFNFKSALRQAEHLEQVASQLKNISNQSLNSTFQRLSSGWKGDNATAYIRKGSKLQGEIGTTARDLNNLAGDIRRIAKRIYDAEMEALRIAESRD